MKPAIYLYPTQTENISVKLNLSGKITKSIPEYPANGWNVTATPEGKIYDESGNEYPYLFWEADVKSKFNFDNGFCVKGGDTEQFLRQKLAEIGLNERECAEFIEYWLPLLQNNRYNIITFQGKAYTDSAKLDITPKPDSVLRVFMTYKPADYAIDIAPQHFEKFRRRGFTVVEWGGCDVK